MCSGDAPLVRDPAAEYDQLGRKVPHRLNMLHYARAIPNLLAGFDREVPGEFLFQVDATHIEVACPCGETPSVEALQLQDCGCGRWFLNTGRTVIVHRPDAVTGRAAA